MIIGLDFDNTIVCHDRSIKEIAKKYFDLPRTLILTKENVRDHLRSTNREGDWTIMQGIIYGPGMIHAVPENGVISCLKHCNEMGHSLKIISHRSKFPYAGDKHDLHMYGREWIRNYLQKAGLFKGKNEIFFCETKKEKLRKIEELKCDIFVDDLPEILKSPDFPKTTKKVLYDSQCSNNSEGSTIINSWAEFEWILNQ